MPSWWKVFTRPDADQGQHDTCGQRHSLAKTRGQARDDHGYREVHHRHREERHTGLESGETEDALQVLG
jgi:hypothetical protein